jgi:hypothetical protein
MSIEQNKLSGLLGINKADVDKMQDILPTFDLTKVEIGGSVIMQALEEPKKVTWTTEDDEEKTSHVLPVMVLKIIRKDGLEVPMNDKLGLWLSSKTLSIGILRLVPSDRAIDLIGKKFQINVSTARYKQGVNRCYNVRELA